MAYNGEVVPKGSGSLKKLAIIASIFASIAIVGRQGLDCVARFYPPQQQSTPTQQQPYFMTADYDPNTKTISIQPPEEAGLVKSIANTLGYSGNMLENLADKESTDPTNTQYPTQQNTKSPIIMLLHPFGLPDAKYKDSIDDKVAPQPASPITKKTGTTYSI
ncbi:hypothetical protein HOC35_07305 [Candidatus Woesearchaeota archaeon]|jgi:hypothetical protein|nr:hypothetical protein [Candidatus Woesearchaeota archaeon]